MLSDPNPQKGLEQSDAVLPEYDSPMLVRIDDTRKLLQGHVYTRQYRDCQSTGTTDYNTC